MADVGLRTVAELMGHKRIQMTMRYADLGQAHKQSAVDLLGDFNRKEKIAPPQNAESPAILNSPADERTGTRPDIEEKGSLRTPPESVQ